MPRLRLDLRWGVRAGIVVAAIVAGGCGWGRDEGFPEFCLNPYGCGPPAPPPPDRGAPQLDHVSPEDGAAWVSSATRIYAYFYERLSPGSVAPQHCYVRDESGAMVDCDVEYRDHSFVGSNERGYVRLEPRDPLEADTRFTVTLTTGLADLAGNRFERNYSWNFGTGPEEQGRWEAIATVDMPFGTPVWADDALLVWSGDGPDQSGRYDPASDTWHPISRLGSPSSRSRFSVVWTGDEMIVWGGWAGGACLQGGGTYDPVRDEWRPLSETGAPGARCEHLAVWTGAEMLIWAGNSGESYPDYYTDGAAYDPVADVWRPISTDGAHALGVGPSSVWTGSEWILWGGRANKNTSARSGGGRAYDPVRDSWRELSRDGAPPGRSAHSAVWTGLEMIVFGGYSSVFDWEDKQSERLNDGGAYDPRTDSWRPLALPKGPPARASHAAVWTGTRMILWGGYGTWPSGVRHDPSTGLWENVSTVDAPHVEWNAKAFWTGWAMIAWAGLETACYTP